MTITATTLFRASRAGISFADAAPLFSALTAHDTDSDVLALVCSERSVDLVSLPALSTTLTRDAYEAECWSPSLSLRWVATSETRPFVGQVTLLSETPLAQDGWAVEEIECSARPTRYACWGDVAEVRADRLEVGDDARRFQLVGSKLAARSGDRLSIEAIEYVRGDAWGNQAVFDERLVGLVIDGGRG